MRIPGVPYVQGRNSYPDGDGKKFAIAIHNTSNDASDEGEASYATRRTDGVSSHFYVDADSITQSLDTDARAGHAGSRTGNENAIAVEITGANGWTRDRWLKSVAWERLAQVLAVLCRHYGIEPRRASVAEMKANPRVRAFYGHDDMRRAWGGTTHTDPGPNFPWDHLLATVRRALDGETTEDEMTRDEIADAVVVGVHQALGMAARRDTPTGRQIGDSVRTLLAPLAAGQLGIAELVAKESTSPEEARALLDTLARTIGPDVAEQVLAGLGGRSPADVAAALVAAGQDPARLAAELTALTAPGT